MNNEILFIMPNSKMLETINEVLQERDVDYPALYGSMQAALDTVERMKKKGTRVAISTGITARFLKEKLDIPVLEIDYGQVEFINAISEALEYSKRVLVLTSGITIVRTVNQCLALFKDSSATIDVRQYVMGRPLEEQAEEIILEGDYDVVISATPAVEVAKRNGRHGILFDIDTKMVEIALANAEMLVQLEKSREERERAIQGIMEFSHEGMICVDANGFIWLVNHAAEQMLRKLGEDVKGQPIDEVLEKCNIVNVLDPGAKDNVRDGVKYVTITQKPLNTTAGDLGRLILLRDVNEAQEVSRLAQSALSRKGLVAKRVFNDIEGTSVAIDRAKNTARAYAEYDSTILITGESGTGKEFFAQSVHNASQRKFGPFVAVNCAALPESLLESELFGYVKGAFTGARNEGRVGMFELANKGTLFLDEIGEIPLGMQARLLRAVQEREIMRIGDDKVIPVDVRIITASNKNLFQMVSEGKFREDLYYRLSVLELRVPSLRERSEDIEAISYSILRKKNQKMGRFIRRIDQEVLDRMKQMPWHGNVRQLDSMIEKLIILSKGDHITMDAFKAVTADSQERPHPVEEFTTLKKHEDDYILRALKHTLGNKAAYARLLGINSTTLWRRLGQIPME